MIQPIQEKTKVKSALHAAEVFHALLNTRQEEDAHKEFAYVMGLNARNVVLFVDLITIGTVTYAAPAIRECYRQAIVKNAAAIIFCHNHPSGDTVPSAEDNDFTRKMSEAGRVLGVKMLDHIIVADTSSNFYSYADEGRL